MSTFKAIKLAAFGLLCSGAAAVACSNTYVVERGDTLSEIAQFEAGTVLRLPQIIELNKAALRGNPNRLLVGQVLLLPCDTESIETVDWSVMPLPQDLVAVQDLADVQIVDIRSAKAIKKSGTLPGALHIPYKAFRGPKSNPGQPPSDAELAELIGGSGLRLDQPIVLVHTKASAMDMGRAALVYWILKSSGAEQIAILRGGYAAWTAADLETTAAPGEAQAYDVSVTFSKEWRADVVDIYGLSTGQTNGYLLDARPHKVVSKLSKAGEAVATTLFGSQNTPAGGLMSSILEADPKEGVAEVVAYLKENEIDWTKGQVVSFCHSGELAALNWFYSSELAGLSNFKLYPESVKGWANMGGTLFAPETEQG